MKVTVIGVAGGTGSGKSTLVKRLQDAFKNDDVATLCHDYYYKAHPELSYEERTKLNYDHPNAFDNDLLIEHINLLKQGKNINCPKYDYALHDRSDKTELIESTEVILLEGILIFENKELLKELDMKIYVDTDADVRILRRILRDVKERGRSLDSVIEQYLSTVKPMHEAFVEPSKRYADIIVPVGGENAVACQMIIDRIEKHLK